MVWITNLLINIITCLNDFSKNSTCKSFPQYRQVYIYIYMVFHTQVGAAIVITPYEILMQSKKVKAFQQ